MTPTSPQTDAIVVDLAAHRASKDDSFFGFTGDDNLEDDYEPEDLEITPPTTAPPPPRQQQRGKGRSRQRRLEGLTVYSDLLAESKAAQKRYEAAAKDYETSLIRIEAERFDPAESVDELCAQVAYLTAGRFDFAPWIKQHGYLTARQSLLLLDLCQTYGLAKPGPEVFPPVRRTAAQVDDPAQLKRLAPYLSPQARAALRRSR
ncbi:hypothetical protein L6R46_22640 [Myxococcota bacterium]|nr:hypothetical protein [Myxococcota bacterium]